MKKTRFKNVSFRTKRLLTMTIALTIFLVIILSTYFIKSVPSSMKDYISLSIKKQNILILKNAFKRQTITKETADQLIRVIQNSKEEIVEVNFDTSLGTKLLTEITSYMNEELNDYNFLGYRIDVPIGLFSNNYLFSNIGPKIPIKVEVSDTALGNIRTTSKSLGINMAQIEIYLDIYIKTSVLLPFETYVTDTQFSSLIASKIVSGTVPNFLGTSLNSKSDTINLPLNE